MTSDNVPMQDPIDQNGVADEAVKPKRTRRPKAAAETAVTPEAQVSAPQDDVAPAPVKAPRKRKVETVEAVAPAEADVADVADAPKPKRAPRKKADVAVSDVAESSASQVVAAADGAPREAAANGFLQLGPDAGSDGAAQVQPAGEAVSAQQGEGGESRPEGGRSRRDRGRRDRGDRGDRGERPPREPRPMRAEGAPDAPSDVALEGQEPGEARPSRRAAIAAEQASEVFAELLSGDFDKEREEEAEDAAAEEGGVYKRVLRPEPDAPKLQKVLAQAGVGSRRDIEQMIEDGRIEVNDQVAHIGQRISFGDRIKVAGRTIKVRIAPQPARILAYHKPTGEVVTHDDPQGRPTVFRRLPRLQNGKWMSVGRLDLNTEGLLLFTNSGELANQLMHPRFGVEREYAVRVLGTLDEPSRLRLLSGVEIEGQSASFVSISKGEGEGVNQWYRVVITEGRNREVRKLFDAVGLTVNRLIRVRYGAIVLPRGLKRGIWVELGESDLRAVKSLAGMERPEFGQGQTSGQGRAANNKGQQKSQQGFKGQNGQGGPGVQGGQGAQGGRGQQRPNGPGGNGNGQGPRGQGPSGRGQGGFDNRPPRNAPDRDRAVSASHDHDDDDHIGPIPNPLEQTFDKRFVKGSKRITAGFGRPDQQDQGPRGRKSGEPDPLQTSVGYIGADAYFGKVGGGGRGGNRSGGGGGGGRGRR
jgi:23S rRNA pseudouridine2605 synthase